MTIKQALAILKEKPKPKMKASSLELEAIVISVNHTRCLSCGKKLKQIDKYTWKYPCWKDMVMSRG